MELSQHQGECEMSKKWSIEDIAAKVDNEGLGYMITDYLGSDSIEDEELKELWKVAEESLEKIGSILEPYSA